MDGTRAFWHLIDQQRGVAAVWQALDQGVSRGDLRSMLKRGVLQPVCYGIVRASGSERSREQDIQIGILLGSSHRVGLPEAAACGITAAILLGMAEDRGAPIHILCRRRIKDRDPYRFHWTSRLPADELTQVRGLWCTDAPRTFLDLCGSAPHLVRWIYRRGLRNGLLEESSVFRRVEDEARRGRAGVVLARQIIEETSGTARRAKSGFEDKYHDYFVRAGYPPPQRNVKLPGSFGHPWEVDLFYPQVRRAFEISPYETHGSPEAHLRDGRKELDLEGQGIRVLRITEDLSFERFVDFVRPILGAPDAFPCTEKALGEPRIDEEAG